MEEASPEEITAQPGFSPPVLVNGQPVVVATITASSRNRSAYPIAIAWSGSADRQPAERLIRPPAHWMEQDLVVQLAEGSGLTPDPLGQNGSDATCVAAEFGRVAARHAVVTLVPYIDCAGLQKLLSLQSDPSAPGRLSALDVATAIAAALGLGEADFAMAAADSWARSLGRHPVARRVEAGARLIQVTIDAAGGLGLLGARTSIEIAASLPASKRRAGQGSLN